MPGATVFISYSRKDEEEKNQFLSHLSVLHNVAVWSDDKIDAGANWEQEIDKAMTQADVAILLITANFLSSNFIQKAEIPKLLKRHQTEGMTVIPVIFKACAWEQIDWLSELNVRPKNGKPVWSDGGSHIDEDLAAIVNEIANIIGHKPETRPESLSKQRIQIFMHGEFSSLSEERRKSAIEAFAALMGISPQSIEVYGVYSGSIVIDLGIPPDALQRFRSNLQVNHAQLHLIKVEGVKFKWTSDEIEEWVVKDGKFASATMAKKVILYAEDDSDAREMYSFALRYHNFRVLEAVNGAQALQIVREEKIDLIILDVRMPVMSGYDAARLLAKEYPNIPIIFLSARTIPKEVALAFETNPAVIAYWDKPIGPGTLVDQIETILEDIRVRGLEPIRAENIDVGFHRQEAGY